MTAQITDKLVYLGESYELIWDGRLVSYIRDRYKLDLLIGGYTSICERGYVAEYEIQNGFLYLCSLHLFGMIDPRPQIAGVVGEDSYYRVSRKVRKHKPKMERYATTGWVKFSPLKERIEYSGYIVLGQAMKGYEDYMESAAYYPHACQKILGITLANGQPKLVEDFSQEATEIRQQVPKPYLRDENDRQLVSAFSRKVMKVNR